MREWTDAARHELKLYLERARASLAAAGDDAGEVLDDLRRHVEEAAAAAGLTIVTEDDVRRITSRLGLPEPASEPRPCSPAPPANAGQHGGSAGKGADWRLGLLLIFGVIVPFITLVVEWITGMCAAAFFDPLPTGVHGLLVAAVPLGNLIVWRAVASRRKLSLKILGWASGLALGVGLYYTILFLPMTPFGLIGIAYLGFGLLPCSPLLAFLSALFLRRRLCKQSSESPAPGFRTWPGVVVGWVLLLSLGAPIWLTRAGLQWAGSEDPEVERRGMRWLRAFGHEPTLLRACYGRGQGAAGLDPVEWFFSDPQPGPQFARVVYYRVTGRAFNSVPAPRVRTGRGAFAELNDWTWDADQGGDRVGGRIKSLSLHSSRLEATLEPDAAVGYSEWTMEFKNDGVVDREARAQIQLPPGAVVSRLTLWVDGEEREAAFAGRAHVRQAYQQVAIRQRRDPVLVNTCGPDRILVQCYPVPRDGGLIKIRLGFTVPLVLDANAQGRWRWPVILERNFNVRESLQHSVWVQSTTPLALDASLFQAGSDPRSWLGRLREPDLAGGAADFNVPRRAEITTTWTRGAGAVSDRIVQQTLAPRASLESRRLVLVLDGSASMAGVLPEIADLLGELSASLDLTAILLATDEPEWILRPGESARLETDAVARLRQASVRGGHDNVPALVSAWDATGGTDGSVLVWVHGPQPVEVGSPEGLRQCWEREGKNVTLVSFSTVPGPNVLLERLDGLTGIRAFPRQGSVTDDLRRLLTGGHPDGSAWQRSYELVDAPPTGLAVAEGSRHVARLWARDEVIRLQRARRFEEGIRLAGLYQLVTPITGAVVLETAQQFADHNLTPVDPITVPAIPEPAVSVLLLLGLMALAFRPMIQRNCRFGPPSKSDSE
jgi:hypothetical protein